MEIGISISQHNYVLDLLKKIVMLSCNPVDTSMDGNYKIGMKKDSLPVDKGRYCYLYVNLFTYLILVLI